MEKVNHAEEHRVWSFLLGLVGHPTSVPPAVSNPLTECTRNRALLLILTVKKEKKKSMEYFPTKVLKAQVHRTLN